MTELKVTFDEESFYLPYQDKKLMIFEMNGYDWWVDTDLSSAIRNYHKFQLLLVDEEDIETTDAFAISNDRAIKLKFTNTDGDKQTRTFKEQLKLKIQQGKKFPDFFASTEY